MRILISILRFEPGRTLGSEVFLSSFLESFSKIIEKNAVGIVASSVACEWGRKYAENFEWIPQKLPASAVQKMIYERSNIERIARNWKADVIYFPFNIMPRTNTPSVLLIHDLVNEFYCSKFPFYRPFYYHYVRRLVRNSIKNAGTIITISKAVAEELRNLKAVKVDKKIFVVPLAVNRNTGGMKKPDFLPVDGKKIILQSGAQLPHKSHITGIKAMIKIRERNPDVFNDIRLVLTGGDNKDENLKLLINKFNLKDSVVFLGRLNDAELEWVMTNSALACFPSIYEGFGLGIVEAQLHQTPVIASDIAVAREVSGGCADFFEPENEAELADRIVEIIKYKADKSNKIKANAIDNINNWDWRKHSKKVLEILALTIGK